VFEDSCIVFTKPNELFEIKKYFEDRSVEVKDEEIIMDPISIIDIDSSQEEKILDLSNKIEELDDVQNVYMNVNLN
jgi:transcriptional/translational regulatory protein YebC/TACO1